MQNPIRTLRARRALVPFTLALILCVAAPAPAALAAAQQDNAGDSSGETELSRKEEKERAKQARIDEYLRKKEERLARKELKRAEQEQAQQAESPAAAAAGTAAAPATAPQGKQVVLPKELARAQATLRQNSIAQDPTVAEYLDLIDRAEASPHQLAAFGNFLADLGMNKIALEYYSVALSIERDDPILWLNAGTLHRQVQQYSDALSAYKRALSIDPNLAAAHYNLAAVLDQQGKYEEAIDAYRLALTLDPSLGDPAVNPQAANSELLVAVKLLLYQEQVGNLGLPLVEVPGGELASPEREGE